MDHTYWQTGTFAQLTAVSVRTLRFYDRVGLLRPSLRTEAGYRLYQETDLTRLQHILALKFLGFSLVEIHAFLAATPMELQDALRQQHAMLEERRRQLDAVLEAISQARGALQADGERWDSMVSVIRAIQMSQKNDWQSTFFTAEQRRVMEQLSKDAYAPEAKDALGARPAWTEEDQKRVDAQYAALYDGVKQAYAAGEAPDGARSQELAGQAIALIEAFTQGNPAVAAGLQKFWEAHQQLPREQRPVQSPLTEVESAHLERAKQVYLERRGNSANA
ncbi:MAG: MerR family transcriptional regulator [Chloroflexota bacterium]